MNENVDQSSQAGHPEMDVRLADVFSCDRIRLNVEVKSKRRLIELIAKLFANSSEYVMNKDTVFRSLLERENLGSTCLGNGVMVPHSRLHGLTSPLGAVVQMTTPLKVDAHDEMPVSLACGLLVPAECSDLHIRILARLAEGFSEHNLYQRLIHAENESELFEELVKFDEQKQH